MLACQFLDISAAALALLAACIGHTALLTFGLNLLFARPLPRRLLSLVRKAHALLVLPSPILFWFALGLDQGLQLKPFPDTVCCDIMWAYTGLCWVIGAGIFPMVTLKRLLRPRPACVLQNHSEIVDVASRLGYKPVGDGKHRRMARIPLNQLFQVEFTDKNLAMRRLPAAWEGLTILHLSDLHFCGTPDRDFYRLVLDRCRDWEPDLVAVTGDIVDSATHHRWIVPLLGRLRWRIAAFAILGNHDWWRDPALVRRRLRRIGMRVLPNTWQQVEVRGQPLVVVGHEGPWFRPGPDLSACPEGPFRLCLSHTPDNIRWAKRHGVDLMLSGHNHGGQIRLPVVGSVFVPSLYSRRYDCGTFDESPTLLHVSRGLSGLHPLRFNCRPEVTRIVLHKAVEVGTDASQRREESKLLARSASAGMG
jgi:predicted MPP superfamily phosphohydrolase